MADDRWIEVTASQFDHEREGLEYLRERVPPHSPYRVWTNFEFRDTRGGWHEVDALVLGQDALYLLELKHFYGAISGNDRTWTRNSRSSNSPLLLARRKAQLLASKLEAVYEEIAGNNPPVPVKRIVPWVEPAVFLHHRETKVLLPPSSRLNLYGLDELAGTPKGLPGISELFAQRSERRAPIHPQQEEMLALLLARIGLVQRREREAGSWVIVEGGAISEGDGWQDWEASRKETGDRARIRIQTHTTETERRIAEAVARHEYDVMRRLHHDGLIRPVDLIDVEQLGKGLVYDWDDELVRLDLWLQDHGSTIDLGQRLQIIREVGEVLEYAHGKGVVHRGLTPRTIWIGNPVTPGGALTVKVSDWQAVGSSREDDSRPGITRHSEYFDDLEDAELLTYRAPEGAWRAGAVDRPALDQFSLGAIAYFVFAGTAPAATPNDLLLRLREQSGLDLGIEVPEIPATVREAVRTATRAAPRNRHASIRTFLTALDAADSVAIDTSLDPRDATVGDALAGSRFTVKSRLGKGSTAIGLLVADTEETTANKDRVLKVALDERAAARLQGEAEVLRRIDSRRVVSLFEGPFELGSTSALLLERAGEETLLEALRGRERGLPVDLLDTYGGDLLDALEALDKAGIDHRDIKPANLGVGLDRSKRRHLRLFDFSLSRAAASEIEAGTPPYLDPFLGQDGRATYDSAAERYAAAVVLYEMATVRRPQYGDDPSVNPAAITDDVTIDPHDLPEGVRDELVAFFQVALARRASDRFGTISEMRTAWTRMFGDATSTVPEGADELAAKVELETPLAEAGLSPRALSWFEGENLETVKDAVLLDPVKFTSMPGATKVTRAEVQGRAKAWRNRFRETIDATRRAAGDVPPLEDVAELLFAHFVERRSEVPRSVLEMILGQGTKKVDAFAPQVVLSAMLAVGTPTVNQALIDMHKRWSADAKAVPALDQIVAAVDDILDRLGGVAAISELVTELLARTGVDVRALRPNDPRRRLAEGFLRIVVDGRRHRRRGGGDSPPLDEKRRGERVVALGRKNELLDVALRLGQVASAGVDGLSGVLSPSRSRKLVEGALDGLTENSPLRVGTRAVRLGAALSENVAAVSSVGELHHRDLPPADALRIGLGDLGPDARMKAESIQDRVAARFPQIARLPGRPQLDSLVAEAQLTLRFDEHLEAYVGPTVHGDTTGLTQWPPTAQQVERAEAEDSSITRRLEESRRRRSYLVLGTYPTHLDVLERALEARFGARPLAISTLLLDEMQNVLVANPAFPCWDVIVQADARPPGSREALAVAKVVELAMPAVNARLHEALAADDEPADRRAPLLLTEVDLLVRYGQVGELRRLSDLTVSRGRAVWVVVPQYDIVTGPTVDDVQLTTSPHQFLDVDRSWSDAQAALATEPGPAPLEDAP